MTLSFAKRVEAGQDRRNLALHALRRAALIFAVGLLLNAFPYFNLSTLRIPGVLQRIAICYLAAALLFLYTRLRTQIAAIVLLFTAYWLAMTLYPVPGYGPGVLTKEGNFAAYVDRMFLSGHMWAATKTWDPEGVVSSLPAVATVLFGVLAGRLLRTKLAPVEKVAWLFAGSSVLILLGNILSLAMPINKPIWTPPYAVLMAGIAANVFALCYWIVDLQGFKRWSRPFAVYGMNAIAVYVLSGLIGDCLSALRFQGPLYDAIFVPLGPRKIASLLYAVTHVLLLYAAAWLLWRKKWFLRV
jgi:predicted acyltransferase